MGKLTDKLVGQGTAPELSPNPNGSGYTKQVEIVSHNGSTIYFLDGDGNTQTGTAEENVLYLEGEIKYKYLRNAIIKPGTNEIVVPAGWVRVENGPNSYKKDGGRGTPIHKNVAPQVPPHVFNEPVALNGGVTIKGKSIENQIVEIVQEGINKQEISLYDEINIEEALTFSYGSISDVEGTFGYCRIRQTKENEFYMVINFSLKNNSESNKSLGNNVSIYALFPEEISKKIIDVNGKSVNEVITQEAGITAGYGFTDSATPLAGFFNSRIFSILNSTQANKIRLVVRDAGTINAGATHQYTFRIFMTI